MQNDSQNNPDNSGHVALLIPEVAHEIRNLMQSLKDLAVAEHTRAADPESRAQLSKIAEVAQFAGELSTALMSISNGGKGGTEPSSGDVAEAIRTVSSVFNSHSGQTVSLQIVLHEPLLPVALPTSFLKLIIFNIVRNAIEAMLDSPQRMIRITSTTGPHDISIGIWNSGPAIAENVLPRVFDRSVTTKQPAAGHGFGLATVRRLVEQSGGKVGVYNVTEGGVQFDVTLPSRKNPVQAKPKASSPMLSLVGSRFLVIDDDASVREVLSMMIKDLGGGTVVSCESGQEALEMTDRNFDIVLLDLRMQGLSGKETFLRLAPNLQERVVFMTGDGLIPNSLQVGNGAVRPVMFKPVSFTRLCEVVSENLR